MKEINICLEERLCMDSELTIKVYDYGRFTEADKQILEEIQEYTNCKNELDTRNLEKKIYKAIEEIWKIADVREVPDQKLANYIAEYLKTGKIKEADS